MTKQKTLILIPLIMVAGLLTYCWSIIFFTEVLAQWRHIVGLVVFIPVVFFLFKDLRRAIVGLGFFLLLATFNLIGLTPTITTSWIYIGSSGLHTPPVQLLSFGLFTLYFILNLDSLINILLDFKEARARLDK